MHNIPFDIVQYVWVSIPQNTKSQEAFKLAILIDGDNDQFKIKYVEDEDYDMVSESRLYIANDYTKFPEGYNDMLNMDNISEPEILYNLKLRYVNNNQIYTYLGTTLIMINPYTSRPDLYSLDNKLLYRKALQTPTTDLFNLTDYPPHIYGISTYALKSLTITNKDQAIIISGESGAGKSEIAKYIMEYIIGPSDNTCEDHNCPLFGLMYTENTKDDENKEKEEIKEVKGNNLQDKLLSCYSLLESFGNAKTLQNDNSSRYGKYITLLMDKQNNEFKGANIMTYVLEKSRIIAASFEERNYHIFYMMFKFLPREKLEELYLLLDGKVDLSYYNYLKVMPTTTTLMQANGVGGGDNIQDLADQKRFDQLIKALEILQFDNEEINTLWKILAACMHLGQIDFDDSSLNDTKPCEIPNKGPLENICKLLELDYNETSKALITKLFNMPNVEPIVSPLQKGECYNTRDTMAKALYNRLFTWLIRKLNEVILPKEMNTLLSNNIQQFKKSLNDYNKLSILDIFGFENLELNTFEQFCINYANEKLQQFYIVYIFKIEQQELINEELGNYLDLLGEQNNQPLLEMIDSYPNGIFQLIDESSTINSSDDKLLMNILRIHCEDKENNRIYRSPWRKDEFTIVHTAKKVDYNINTFRMKNKDELSQYISKAISNSTNKMIVKIWESSNQEEIVEEENLSTNELKVGVKSSNKFLGAQFRAQIKNLISTLELCQCHFIKCLRPNESKIPKVFHTASTLGQIRFMGLLETVSMYKKSFAFKQGYKDFYEKYGELFTNLSYENLIGQNTALKDVIMETLEKSKFQITENTILFGKTKVFMKNQAIIELDHLLNEWLNKKQIIVKKVKNAIFRTKQLKIFRKMLQSIKKLQKFWKMHKEKRKFLNTKKKIKKIQSWWLHTMLRRKIATLKKNIKKIQSYLRMLIQTRKYKQILASSKIINRVMRGGLVRRRIRRNKIIKAIIKSLVEKSMKKAIEKKGNKAAIKIQKHIKGYFARVENHEIIEKIKKIKFELRFAKSARIIQRYFRGHRIRSHIVKSHRAAYLIQGYFKMTLLSYLFQQLRWSARVIQNAVRRWLIRRNIVLTRLQMYLEKEYGNKDIGIMTNELNSTNKEGCFVKNAFKAEQYSLSRFINSPDYLPKLYQKANITKDLTPFAMKKINICIRLLDIEMLTDLSEIYETRWEKQFLDLQKDCAQYDSDIQIIQLGDYHTLAISNTTKAYSWGWNYNYQLGRTPLEFPNHQIIQKQSQIILPNEFGKIKQATTGNHHNLLLDHSGNLLIWGSNNKNQLGIGHTKDIPKIIKLNFLEKHEKIIDIKACGDHSIAITENGKAYVWPFEDFSSSSANAKQIIAHPIELPLSYKIQISSASCGYEFTILIAKNGLLFSFGKDNREGPLGLGDRLPRNIPTLIETLRKEGEKITNVKCGYKHVIAKTSLGRVYTWGWGSKGQLGHGTIKSELQPKLLNMTGTMSVAGTMNTTGMMNMSQTKAKALNVNAGFHHSIILLDNRKLIWFGTNCTIKQQLYPIEVNLQERIPDININEFIPTRVLCSWSKTMSITYITIADTRTCDLTIFNKQKVMNTLVTKIEEFGAFDDVDPPYVDSIANYFPVKIMKTSAKKVKNTAGSSGKKANNTSIGGLNLFDMDMLLMEKHNKQPYPPQVSMFNLDSGEEDNDNDNEKRKGHEGNSGGIFTSALRTTVSMKDLKDFKHSKTNMLSRNAESQSQIRTTDDLKEKLKEIKKRMDEIIKIPKDNWTTKDIEFMKVVSEPKMLTLLKNVNV